MNLTAHNGTPLADVIPVGRVGVVKARDLRVLWKNETGKAAKIALYAKGDGVVRILKKFPEQVKPDEVAMSHVRWFPGHTGKTDEKGKPVFHVGAAMVDITVALEDESRMICLTAETFEGPTYEQVFAFVMSHGDEYELDGDDPVDVVGSLVSSGLVQI